MQEDVSEAVEKSGYRYQSRVTAMGDQCQRTSESSKAGRALYGTLAPSVVDES